MSGFFKLHYDITKWEHWHDPKMLVVWVHLLARARWDKKPTRYKGVLIGRGMLLLGLKEFAKECGLSVQTVRTCLNVLKSTSEITTESTNKGTIVTIEKYAFWQDKHIEPTSELTSKLTTQQQPSNNPVTTRQQLNNKDNNINKDYKHTAREVGDDKKVYEIDGEIWTKAELREDARRRGLNMEMWEGLKNKEWA